MCAPSREAGGYRLPHFGLGSIGQAPGSISSVFTPEGPAARDSLHIYLTGKKVILTDFPGIAMRSAPNFFLQLAKYLLLTAGFSRCGGISPAQRLAVAAPHPKLTSPGGAGHQRWVTFVPRAGLYRLPALLATRMGVRGGFALRTKLKNQYLILSSVAKATDHSDVKCLFLKIQCCQHEYFNSIVIPNYYYYFIGEE